jgi:hypothetical protein
MAGGVEVISINEIAGLADPVKGALGMLFSTSSITQKVWSRPAGQHPKASPKHRSKIFFLIFDYFEEIIHKDIGPLFATHFTKIIFFVATYSPASRR